MKTTALFAGLALFSLAACSSSSSNDGGNASDSGAPEDSGTTSTDDGGSATHGGNPDAGVDASVATGQVSAGIEGKSCADACKALSKTCTPTCTFHDSLGGPDKTSMAGAGFYSHTTSDSSGSFTVNAERFEPACATVFTATWSDNPEDPGTSYEVDYTYS
ncbi:MAG TPA: hypothetical protein VF407_12570, partial [Polyangiaceae bacterium]